MPAHKWTFKSQFRANAYGWKGTALASKRLKEAVSEIKKVAKANPALAADGAVALMERIWPSLQGIDGSSGALGATVNRTLEALIHVIVTAPADTKTRAKWLDRLYEAVREDGVDYLSLVEDHWGNLCDFDELVHEWADRLLPLLRQSWARDERGAWVKGATICLSCLVAAERYVELDELLKLRSYQFWAFDKFWAEALARQGRTDEAIAYAEEHRKGEYNYDESDIVGFCERTLIDAGRRDEAYKCYGMEASRATTHLATYRKIIKKYPQRDSRQVLLDLIAAGGAKGKWFPAAKDAGHLDLAVECAAEEHAEPATLIRAARDFQEQDPQFAAQVALHAIEHLLAGRGYEPTSGDVLDAHNYLLAAAERTGRQEWTASEVRRLLKAGSASDRQEMLDALADRVTGTTAGSDKTRP